MIDIRRRLMGGRSYNWQSVATLPYMEWAINKGTKNTATGVITFNPTALDWTNFINAKNLKYKWSAVKGHAVHLACDCTISGRAENGYIYFSWCNFTTNSPGVGTARTAYGLLIPLSEAKKDGAVHFDTIVTVPTTGYSGTLTDSDYFGNRIYIYTGKNSSVTLSNIVFDVDI